jgi:hypothetical protein
LDYVCFVDRDGLICWARDCGCHGIDLDHSHVGLSERIGFGDGDSGRVFGNTVTDESLACVDRGNGNTHTDRDGHSRDRDLGCSDDLDYVCCVDRDGLICWARDCGSYGIRHDHRHVGFSERIGFGDGESGRVFGNTVADESVACVDRGNGNTHTDREGHRRDRDLGCSDDLDHIEFVDRDGLICWARDCGSYGIRHDHSHVGFSERIGFGDGDSGRVFGNAVTDESLVRVDRGNGNTHTDRDGRTWRDDARRYGHVDVNEHSGSHRLVCRIGDFGCHGIDLDHCHVGLSERIGFCYRGRAHDNGRGVTELAFLLIAR